MRTGCSPSKSRSRGCLPGPDSRALKFCPFPASPALASTRSKSGSRPLPPRSAGGARAGGFALPSTVRLRCRGRALSSPARCSAARCEWATLSSSARRGCPPAYARSMPRTRRRTSAAPATAARSTLPASASAATRSRAAIWWSTRRCMRRPRASMRSSTSFLRSRGRSASGFRSTCTMRRWKCRPASSCSTTTSSHLAGRRSSSLCSTARLRRPPATGSSSATPRLSAP
ncbi:hypothetical protein L611_000400001100 [Aminobacter sp. J15]|nr:hypothetical protein L611_000400001100 [Aminobacter sp. J15]